MENLNILVTGGCGFIGSNIVEYGLDERRKTRNPMEGNSI